tara:strand:- start:198 stop:1481 length:1284 start_codon:yes stop_codon:yes gene_type:complete
MPFVVKPKLKVCIDCHTGLFSLYDVTGPWDATLNPYGWAADGSGDNIELDQVLSSGLTITAPSGTVYGPYSLLSLTITTASFTVPAVGSNVTISVSSSSPYYTAWLTTGQPFYVAGAGYYRAVTVTASSIVATNLGSAGNAAPTTVIASGKNVGTAVLPSLNGYSLVIDPANILGTGDGQAISDGVWLFDWTVAGEYISGQTCVLTEVLGNTTFSSGASWNFADFDNGTGTIAGGLLQYNDVVSPGGVGTVMVDQTNCLVVGTEYLITIDITLNQNCSVEIVDNISALAYTVAVPGQTGVVTLLYTPTASTDFTMRISGVGNGLTHSARITSTTCQYNVCTGGNDVVFNSRCAKQTLALCSVQCCTDKLIADSDVGCACSKGGNKKSINAHLTLAAINAAWSCGKVERAKSLLTKLQDLCNNNCKNC